MAGEDPCWVCESDATVPFAPGATEPLTSEDLKISDSRYGRTLPLQRCERCGFVFARRSTLPSLTSLYEALDDAEYGESEWARQRQMAHLLRWATRDQGDLDRLLDVGAANGILLAQAEELGLTAVGVEPSRPLGGRGQAQGRTIHIGVLPHPELEGEMFDLVTLVDVIEHVSDPVGLLVESSRHLDRGGQLLVVTPDLASLAARALGKRWWHRRLAHVGYFSRRSLTTALARAGLVPRRWGRPRWYFPADYLASRVLRYVPGRSTPGSPTDTESSRSSSRWVIPLNLRDSLAVVAGHQA